MSADFFRRADDVRWRSDVRFIPLSPFFFIWEPLHCHTWCLDTVLHVILKRVGPLLRHSIVEKLSSCGRKWPDERKSAHSFVIKEVCFSHPLFFFYSSNSTDKEVLRAGSRRGRRCADSEDKF